MKTTGFVLALSIVVLSGCRSAAPNGEASEATADLALKNLSAILWVQTAAEFDAISLQTWKSATEAMRERLDDRSPSAAVESTSSCVNCPPAVIVDVDETVLDNSAADARRIIDGTPFDPEVWTAWVNEREAREIPGAAAFAREADRLGVTVFYVTNRTQAEEAGTRDNLRALGFPISDDLDTVLTKGDLSATVTSDKTDRRKWIASRYRILVIAGDDLNDFIPARLGVEERDALVESHASKWGDAWFMLPNPVYGSWEGALLRDLPSGATDAQRREWLLRSLDLAQ